MASILSIPTSQSELKSVQSLVSEAGYHKITSQRGSAGATFSQGTLTFSRDLGSDEAIVPNKSYMTYRVKFGRDAATRISKIHDVAPGLNPCSTLHSSVDFRINGTSLDKTTSNIPQVDTMLKRQKSRAWLQSQGEDLLFMNGDVKKRQNIVAIDGVLPSEDPNDEVAIGRLALGFDALNTVQYTAATNLLTFAANGGAAPPDVRTIFPPGTAIRFTGAAAAALQNADLIVTGAPTALTLRVTGNAAIIDVAAAVMEFSKVHYGAKAGRKLNEIEFIHTLDSLAPFNLPHILPGGARYELEFVPNQDSVWKKNFCEALLGNKTVDTDYTLSMVECALHLYIVRIPRISDGSLYLDMEKVSCQAQAVGSGVAYSTLQFNIPKSTHTLAVAYQDSRVGTDSRISPTKFSSKLAGVISGAEREESKLTRFSMDLGGRKYPSREAILEFADSKDHNFSRYYQNIANNGSMYDNGGAENIDEWRERGMYILEPIKRDGGNVDTRLSVNHEFLAGTSVANMNCLVFAFHRGVARLDYKGGRCVDVQVQEA